jgi:hypothetical protein
MTEGLSRVKGKVRRRRKGWAEAGNEGKQAG